MEIILAIVIALIFLAVRNTAVLTTSTNLFSATARDKSRHIKIDGSSNTVWYGAFVMDSGGKGVRLSGSGAKFYGLSAQTVTTDSTGKVWCDIERDELTVGGSPTIGADVYCATDNIEDITTSSSSATKVGVIVSASLTTADKYTVWFIETAKQ